ncbi:Rv1733c family protein [Actinomadura alba]|uniref:Uncharacterized protein n=1 Tax=Actinomadura alba TaxID=406431 RepID=A0ABR7LYK9_9ACTN|nr:hypothetical protein [Actinomadura alba]MBC6469773.1 hypothetical protein [Actinomadura alba]
MRGIWARLDRARRRLGLDRNDLRRGVDRVQWALASALLMVFLAAAPATASIVADHVYDSGVRTEHREKATRHQIDATVIGVAEASRTGQTGATVPTVRLRWSAPDGTPRTGEAPARGSTATGTTQRIWIDDSGAATARPRRHVQTVGATVYAATGTTTAIGGLLLIAYGTVRRRCDRCRSRLWDVDWARLDRRRTG